MHTVVLSPGTLLNRRYRIIGQAGGGGMGIVYKAADTRFGGRVVAVKEMRHTDGDGTPLSPQHIAEARSRFSEEAMLLARLQYPSLPSIFDHFEENNRSYLVMEFIEGGTLDSRLRRASGAALPLDEALRIVGQICAALEYLHTRQPPIIFRDLKPSNIMLTPQGDVYLIDFGIARLFKPGQSQDTRMAFTPGYAAPEQLLGIAQTDPRADIFSLGVVLYEMLSGVSPAQAPYTFAPVSARRRDIPAALGQLVARMVEIDPSKRPSSIARVRQDLASISGAAGPSRPLAPAPPHYAPPPVPSPAYARPQYPQPGYGQPRPPRKSQTPMIAGIVGGIVLLCLVACGVLAYSSFSIPLVAISASATETALAQGASPNETVIYQDSMTDSPAGWSNDSHCAAKADGYHITGGYVCNAPDSASAPNVDVTVTVKGVKTSSNTAYGIIFRHKSSGNFYSFEVTPDGQWGFYKFVNGNATAISDYQSSAAIQTGSEATNEMRVLAVGSHFVFYVNSQEVSSADDSTFTAGGVGLANDDSDATSDIVFTNLTVAQPQS